MGNHPIRMWDEAAFAVQSYEMLQHHSWLVTYFEGIPSVSSAKPPLQNWAQMVFIKFNGLSEVSIRLPSAIAAATVVFLLFFLMRTEIDNLFAWISSLVLLTSQGFIGWHTARTGDADSMLALWLFLQFVSVYYIFKSETPTKWIWVFFVSLFLAFLTKAFAAAFFLAGFIFYALIFEQTKTIALLKNWKSYAGFLMLILLLACYYILREKLQPGYIEYATRVHAGRYIHAIGPHKQPWDFYIMNFINGRYTWWIALAMIGMVMAVFRNRFNARLGRISVITIFTTLALLSGSVSKLEWYENPLYPILAICTGIPIYNLIKSQFSRETSRLFATGVLFLLPLMFMYRSAQSNYPGWTDRDFEIKEHYLFKMIQKNIDPGGMIVMKDNYYGGLIFYKHMFEQRGQRLEVKYDIEFNPGDRVLVSTENFEKKIVRSYTVDTLETDRTANVLLIKAKRNVED